MEQTEGRKVRTRVNVFGISVSPAMTEATQTPVTRFMTWLLIMILCVIILFTVCGAWLGRAYSRIWLSNDSLHENSGQDLAHIAHDLKEKCIHPILGHVRCDKKLPVYEEVAVGEWRLTNEWRYWPECTEDHEG